MAPKKKFAAEQIVDAAFGIAKTEGMDSITIRKVAERLGSSIAPIYVNFADAEELKRAVIAKIGQLSRQMIREQRTGSPFGDIGAASLQFASEYPVLIRELITKPNDYMRSYDEEMGAELVQHMKTDPELAEFTEEELMTILLKMRAFQIGMTIMAANAQLPEAFDLRRLTDMLNSAAEDVVTTARRRKRDEGDSPS